MESGHDKNWSTTGLFIIEHLVDVSMLVVSNKLMTVVKRRVLPVRGGL